MPLSREVSLIFRFTNGVHTSPCFVKSRYMVGSCILLRRNMNMHKTFNLVLSSSGSELSFEKNSCLFVDRKNTTLKLLIHNSRKFSLTNMLGSTSEISSEILKKLLDQLTDKFMEARELLDDARQSQGTVYFSEDMEDAQEAVSNALKDYKSLLEKLGEQQKQNVVRTIGLRMEELKAQEQAIKDSLKD